MAVPAAFGHICDGVFAIAIAIFVLEMKIPIQFAVASSGLAAVILTIWSSYLLCHVASSSLDFRGNP
jgi:uncharacterized membrane protein